MAKFQYRSDTGFFPTFNKAWRKLKKEKILAYRGSCCRTCSASEVGEKLRDPKYADYVGYVDYNAQDRDGVKYDGFEGATYMYVGFGTNWVKNPYTNPTEKAEQLKANYEEVLACAVARIAKLVFEREGFVVEWDGTHRSRLKLIFPDDK